MKFKLIIIAFFASTVFVACDDKPELVADFSNTTPVYVELSSKAVLAAKEGTTATLPIRLREGQQQNVIASYAVTGAVATTGTATISRNSLIGNITVNIPANVVPVGSTTVDAIVTLKSASMGSQALRVGFLNSTSETRTIRISK